MPVLASTVSGFDAAYGLRPSTSSISDADMDGVVSVISISNCPAVSTSTRTVIAVPRRERRMAFSTTLRSA